jgi:hypothetical protein
LECLLNSLELLGLFSDPSGAEKTLCYHVTADEGEHVHCKATEKKKSHRKCDKTTSTVCKILSEHKVFQKSVKHENLKQIFPEKPFNGPAGSVP